MPQMTCKGRPSLTIQLVPFKVSNHDGVPQSNGGEGIQQFAVQRLRRILESRKILK